MKDKLYRKTNKLTEKIHKYKMLLRKGEKKLNSLCIHVKHVEFDFFPQLVGENKELLNVKTALKVHSMLKVTD